MGRGMRRVSGKPPASAQAMTQAGVGCSDVNGTDKVSCSWSEATFSRKADDGGLSLTLHGAEERGVFCTAAGVL